jgi:hypothetical protein
MTRSTLIFATAAALALTQGCGATQIAQPETPILAQSPTQDANADYRAALEEALDLYEAQVRHAARSWYSDYAAAERAHLDLRRPDIGHALSFALERRGRSLEELNAHAAADQAFVREQNGVAGERMAMVRGDLYAVLGRIRPASLAAPDRPGAPAMEYSALLAIPTPAAPAHATAKDR